MSAVIYMMSAVPVLSINTSIPSVQEGAVIYIEIVFFAGYKGNPQKGVSKAFSRMAKGQSMESRSPSRHRMVGTIPNVDIS